MKKKSVAFLFSGQFRAINFELFRKSFALFVGDKFQYDIYIAAWDTMGISMNHTEENALTFDGGNVDSYLDLMFDGFNVKSKNIYSYEDWYVNLSEEYKAIQFSDRYSFITKNSLAQLYLIQQSYLQVPTYNNYDYFIRLRFDSIFVFRLNEFLDNSLIYHLNFGKAFYPDRIYDIFFVAPRNYAINLFGTYSKICEYVDNSFDNGLEKRDACRLLYLSVSNLENPPVIKSLNYRYCDTFRDKMSLIDYLTNIYYWQISTSNNFNDKMQFLLTIPRLSILTFLQFLFFLVKSRIKNLIFP